MTLSLEELRAMLVRSRNGCLEWQGGCDSQGYGKKKIGGRWFKVHRLAYESMVGPIPKGMFVCHRCDNPPCCDPEHLFLGTNSDNIKDACAKGRVTPPANIGEANGRAKLTETDVRFARAAHAAGEATCAALAAKYGVSRATMHAILGRRLWRSVQ